MSTGNTGENDPHSAPITVSRNDEFEWIGMISLSVVGTTAALITRNAVFVAIIIAGWVVFFLILWRRRRLYDEDDAREQPQDNNNAPTGTRRRRQEQFPPDNGTVSSRPPLLRPAADPTVTQNATCASSSSPSSEQVEPLNEMFLDNMSLDTEYAGRGQRGMRSANPERTTMSLNTLQTDVRDYVARHRFAASIHQSNRRG